MTQATAYQLACGTVQRAETAGLWTTLWREHSVYHVRTHKFGTGRQSWETFRTLKKARTAFKTHVQTYH
jgi:hypothetical protein